MENVLTIDVEDYNLVSAFADMVRFDDWPGFESRVESYPQRLLELLHNPRFLLALYPL
jgi:hypothetical protein